VKVVLRAEKPWLAVYGGKLSEEPIGGSLTEFLEEAVGKYRDLVALTQGEREISYGQLLEQGERLAAALASLGIAKGDRVGLMLPNCPEYVIGFFGVVRIGAAATQVNPIYVERELEHIFDNSGSETAIVHATMYRKVKDVQPRTRLRRVVSVGTPEGGLDEGDTTFDELVGSASGLAPEVKIDPYEDLATIQYTGGTTGVSKGAMLTHANILGGIRQTLGLLIEDASDFPENGKAVAVAPLFHIFGLTMVMLSSLRLGLNMLLVPRFQPDEMMQLIKREKPVMLAGVATLYMALHSYPDMEEYGLGDVMLYTSGGASVPLGLLGSFERRTGRPIWEGYGLSEGAPVSFNTYLLGPKGGSIGVPIPGTDVRIVDLETGKNEMPLGEPGELIVKGPQVMKGYLNMPGETANALRDGWLYTGDVARMEEDGCLYVVDRKKDMINTAGFKVYPREVEEVLYGHPEVVEAIAVGIPDEYRGEIVKAFVVRKPGGAVKEDEVISHCQENLAPYKVPRHVEFRDELPKSAVGKLLRRVLAEDERAKVGMPPKTGRGVEGQ
jgi:long-chain acyl-CoA synthetase